MTELEKNLIASRSDLMFLGPLPCLAPCCRGRFGKKAGDFDFLKSRASPILRGRAQAQKREGGGGHQNLVEAQKADANRKPHPEAEGNDAEGHHRPVPWQDQVAQSSAALGRCVEDTDCN